MNEKVRSGKKEHYCGAEQAHKESGEVYIWNDRCGRGEAGAGNREEVCLCKQVMDDCGHV